MKYPTATVRPLLSRWALSFFLLYARPSVAEAEVSDYHLAKMCQEAYQPSFSKGKTTFVLNTRSTLVGPLLKEPIAFFLEHQRHQLLVFRGSATASDWGTNLDASLSRCFENAPTSGMVHQGFCDRAKKLQGPILDHLKKKNAPLYLTGHSQGGALASLLALIIRNHHPRLKIHLVTFGTPSIGDETFSTYLGKAIPHHQRHYMIMTDIVPSLPLMMSFLGTFLDQDTSSEKNEIDPEFSPNPHIIWLPLNTKSPDFQKGQMSGLIQHGIRHYVTVLQQISSEL